MKKNKKEIVSIALIKATAKQRKEVRELTYFLTSEY